MPAVALLGFALLYLGFPTYDYYFDGLTFAMAVEGVAAGGDPDWLLHPHHLLYSPLAYAAYQLAWALGLKVRAWLIMHWLSSLFALAGLGLFYRLLRQLNLSTSVATAGMILLGSCYTYWHFGTQGETTMPATVLLLALLNVVAGYLAAPTGVAGAVRMGLLQGGAALMHQTAVLFIPAACWALWHTTPPRNRTRTCLTFLAIAVGVTAAVYLIVGILVLQLRTPADLTVWLLGYFGADPRTGYQVSYGAWHLSNVGATARAWVQNFIGSWPYAQGAAGWLWYSLAGASVVAILSCLLFSLRGLQRVFTVFQRRSKSPQILYQTLLIWLGIHAIFFTWWKPGHVRFWLLALPAWCLLTLLGFTNWRKTLGISNTSMAWGLALLVAATTALGPFRFEISPSCNRFLSLANALATHTEPHGTIIISGVGPYTALKAYVPYFSRRNMLILDWEFADKTIPPARALVALDKKIRDLTKASPVYLISEALARDLDQHFQAYHGISGETRRQFFAAFPKGYAVELEPDLTLIRLSQ